MYDFRNVTVNIVNVCKLQCKSPKSHHVLFYMLGGVVYWTAGKAVAPLTNFCIGRPGATSTKLPE